ncbi:MAG: VOC family protein [Actinomycetota bacterium]|nr:VOC family protein [Actinomycetota bacterium]
MHLTHVRLLVDDFGAAFRFYRDVLGLEPSFGDEEGPYASFATEPASLSIFTRDGQRETVDLRDAGDSAVVPLEVDDVDGDAERLGLSEPVSRADWGIRVTYVRDPSGNVLELYTPIPMEE